MRKKNFKIMTNLIVIVSIVIILLIYWSYEFPLSSHRVFGVTYMTMNNPFYEVINNELLKSIEENGDELITLDPALDINKQNEQIYRFIEQKVDGIFVNPIDSIKIQPALKAAKEASIPVIVIDAPINDDNLADCTIVSDNYDAGIQCAQDMMKRMDQANIILLKHSTVKSAKDRIDGFLDAIQNNDNYQIIGEGECEGQLEIAMPLMKSLLEKNADVDVVMALNDPSALGALAALESKGKEDVIVYSVDGTPDLKSLIGQNDMVGGTVAQSPISLGQNAAQQMYCLLSGESIGQEMIVPVFMINKDNVSQYNVKGWQ